MAPLRARQAYACPVPLLEFECDRCEARFTELVAAGAGVACPECGTGDVRRRWSSIAPPTPLLGLSGRRATASESYRSEREARRRAGLSPDPPGKKPPYPGG